MIDPCVRARDINEALHPQHMILPHWHASNNELFFSELLYFRPIRMRPRCAQKLSRRRNAEMRVRAWENLFLMRVRKNEHKT